MWLVDCNEDKRNLSVADRSHQLALTHLRQRTIPNVFASTSNHQGCDLRGVVSSDNFNYHGLASWGHYLIQQQRVYPVVWMGTLSNDAWGNLSLCFFLIEMLKRSCRLPKLPSMAFIRRERMKRWHTIGGGTTSSWTCSSTIGCGPIWSKRLNGSEWSIGQRLTTPRCCHCCAVAHEDNLLDIWNHRKYPGTRTWLENRRLERDKIR